MAAKVYARLSVHGASANGAETLRGRAMETHQVRKRTASERLTNPGSAEADGAPSM